MPGQVVPPRRRLKAFPNAFRVGAKTPRSGGGLRTRWKDQSNGRIYEWNYQHGRVEAYNPRGEHLGEYDADTGQRLNGPTPGRTVIP